jgi:hypothetical protein
MTQLIITDIRKSSCDIRFDLITAILSQDGHEAKERRYLDERTVLVLESATAQEETPAIGVHSGDQYIRLRAKPGHGLMVGEKISIW